MTNSTDEDNKIMSAHFLYLKKLLNEDKLFFAGPTLIESDPFGVIILQTDNESEAGEIMDNHSKK